MKKIFAVLLVLILILCGCEAEKNEECPCVGHPAMLYNGIHYVNPNIPVKELPEGYEYAGTVSEEMGHKTGNKDIPFYTNPETDDFYTYQMTGTFVGENTVDTTKQEMHYVQWVPSDNS